MNSFELFSDPSILNEGKSLIVVFKNAVSFTLAITTLTEISRESPEYLYLILSTIVVVALVTLIRLEITRMRGSIELKMQNDKKYSSLIYGPVRCLGFLSSILLNILTQFLSTLVARYIITFVPDPSDIYNVSYILIIVLCLFWCALYTIGIDWRQLP